LYVSFDRFASHFGHPGHVVYHTAFAPNRYMRTFRSNPKLEFVDGKTEVVDAREGWVDVRVRLDEAIAHDVLKMIQAELKQ